MGYSNNRTLNKKEKDGEKKSYILQHELLKYLRSSGKFCYISNLWNIILNLRQQRQMNAQYIILCT